MSTRTFSTTALLLGVLTLLLPACDSNDGGGIAGGRTGNATATVSGDVSATFDGSAFADASTFQGFNSLDVTLTSGPVDIRNAFSYEGAIAFVTFFTQEEVAIDTYTIDEDVFGAVEVEFLPDVDAALVSFQAVSGTVTVSGISASEIRGSFSVEMREADGDRTATMNGSFTAPIVEQDDV